MKQQDCIDTIGPIAGSERGLGRLWLSWLAGRMKGVPDRLLAWLDRSRQRRHLTAMDDRMLRDIGISRAAAWSESRKWFWQP